MGKELERKVGLVLNDVQNFTGQGAAFLSAEIDSLIISDTMPLFCRECLNNDKILPLCRYSCHNAAMSSLSSGEPDYQRCWAGLLFTAIPVAPGGKFCGSLSIAGFTAEDEENESAELLVELLPPFLTEKTVSKLRAAFSLIQPITAQELRGMGIFLMQASFSNGINSEAFFSEQNERYLQQRHIAEEFSNIKFRGAKSAIRTVADAEDLLTYLDQSRTDRSRIFVTKYLARMIMTSNWNVERLRAHLRVLLALITNRELLAGTEWARATSREMRYMLRLEQARTIEDLCYEANHSLIRYLERKTESEKNTHEALPDRLESWIQQHYGEKVSLNQAGRALGASVSSIVQCMRNERGKTFGGLLREIRVGEAKKLLATSDMSVSDIALACGFTDQSHFTRTMKKYVNLTPGEFRRLLKVSKETVLKN